MITFLQAKSTDAPQQTTASDAGGAGEAGEAGEGSEAVKSEDVKPKDKDKKADATQQQATAEPSAQGKLKTNKLRTVHASQK